MLVKSPAGGQASAAAYIADLADELRRLAETDGLPFVAYLLSMASEEARVAASGAAATEMADAPGKIRLVGH